MIGGNLSLGRPIPKGRIVLSVPTTGDHQKSGHKKCRGGPVLQPSRLEREPGRGLYLSVPEDCGDDEDAGCGWDNQDQEITPSGAAHEVNQSLKTIDANAPCQHI